MRLSVPKFFDFNEKKTQKRNIGNSLYFDKAQY